MAELSKNISDLNKVGAASAAGAAPATAPAASTPAAIRAEVPGVPATPTAPQAPASTPEVPAEAASTPADAASAPDTTASAPAAEASAPAAPAPKVVVPPPPPIEEPSFLDGLMETSSPRTRMAGGALALNALARYSGCAWHQSHVGSRRELDSSAFQDGGSLAHSSEPVRWPGVDTADLSLTTGASSMSLFAKPARCWRRCIPWPKGRRVSGFGCDLQGEEILKEATTPHGPCPSIPVKS